MSAGHNGEGSENPRRDRRGFFVSRGHDSPGGGPLTKARAISVLALAIVGALSVWFSAAAAAPSMAAEAGITLDKIAPLTTAVQLGFVAGALFLALTNLADRWPSRALFAGGALVAGASNLALLAVPIGGAGAVACRALTGLALAGVYPIGMKMALGWAAKDRGFVVGLIVGALTLGSASPHLVALLGAAHWRVIVMASSLAACVAAGLALRVELGPRHARAARFDPRAIVLAWTDRRIRLAFIGYLGHMWELYAFWAWIPAIALQSYRCAGLGTAPARLGASMTAFAAIALGAVACVVAGWAADRVGKARIAFWALVLSAGAGLASAALFGGWPIGFCAAAILWGVSIIPDSAQFSALVADFAPADKVGALLSVQTALGFALTALTVQVFPALAAIWSWPAASATLCLGPIAGAVAMAVLSRLSGESAGAARCERDAE